MSQHLSLINNSRGTLALTSFVSLAAILMVGSAALLIGQRLTSSNRSFSEEGKETNLENTLIMDETTNNDQPLLDQNIEVDVAPTEKEETESPTPTTHSSSINSSVNVSNTNGSVRIETNTNGQKTVKEYTTDDDNTSVNVNVNQKVSNGVTIKDSVNVEVNGESIVDND